MLQMFLSDRRGTMCEEECEIKLGVIHRSVDPKPRPQNQDRSPSMTRHSLKDLLTFSSDGGESVLPPECALLVLTSTLATPPSFLTHHFLHELLSGTKHEGVVFLSFLDSGPRLAANMKKLVHPIHVCI